MLDWKIAQSGHTICMFAPNILSFDTLFNVQDGVPKIASHAAGNKVRPTWLQIDFWQSG